MKTQLLRQSFDRKGRVCVHRPVSVPVGRTHSLQQILRAPELCHHSINTRDCFHLAPPVSGLGRICLISKIEITGRKRIKRNKRARNSPMLPVNVAQSQNVG